MLWSTSTVCWVLGNLSQAFCVQNKQNLNEDSICLHFLIYFCNLHHNKCICICFFKSVYSCVFNTSHTVLGDMPNFYEKPVCITRHAIPFYERPGCNTEHTNSLLMWQWHHYCFEVTREGLRPGCNSRHGTLFTQRPGWNKRIWGKIQWVLNRSPVTCIQD